MSDKVFATMPATLQNRTDWLRDRYKSVRLRYRLRSILPPGLRMGLFKDI